MARMTFLLLVGVLVLGGGCTGHAEQSVSAEPVHLPETTGADVEVEVVDNSDAPDTSEEPRSGLVGVRGAGGGGGGTGEGTIALGAVGTVGISPPRSPSTAQEQATRETRRQSGIAAAEAEYRQRCGGIVLSPGLPPIPPQAPITPGLEALRPAYEASLATPLPPPLDNSMPRVNEWAQTVFAAWVQDSAARLRTLDQAAGATPEPDRQHARVWVAHAQALFVERFQGAPIPDEIARDPELRRIYVDAMANQGAPLLRRVVDLTDGVMLQGPWAQWKTSMQTWLAQESCALH